MLPNNPYYCTFYCSISPQQLAFTGVNRQHKKIRLNKPKAKPSIVKNNSKTNLEFSKPRILLSPTEFSHNQSNNQYTLHSNENLKKSQQQHSTSIRTSELKNSINQSQTSEEKNRIFCNLKPANIRTLPRALSLMEFNIKTTRSIEQQIKQNIKIEESQIIRDFFKTAKRTIINKMHPRVFKAY